MRNPTWSFKDRLASSALTMAKSFGAKVIASSSSGNAGAAAAAYAAKAGLPCVVFTFLGAAPPLVAQMRAYGAMVVAVENKADRWRLQSAGVREFGWYPTSPFFGPVVGSNPYGMEGYKTIAFEIAEAFDWEAPDWCVLPVCYGDALFGMWKGFDELQALGWIDRVPRLVAAEVSGSITAAMASGEPMPPDRPRNAASIATSIGASQGTVQAARSPAAQRGRRHHHRERRDRALGGDAGRPRRHLARAGVGRALCRHRAPARQRRHRAGRPRRGAAHGERPEGPVGRSKAPCRRRRSSPAASRK